MTGNGVLNSGLMISQYTAASLVSENKVLAHPASVNSIPSSTNQEDHVSMGTIAARKAMKIVENVTNVLAIELLCAAQAIDLRRSKMGLFTKLGKGTQVVYELVRKQVPQIIEDRVLSDDVKTLAKLIHGGQLARVVEEWIGELR